MIYIKTEVNGQLQEVEIYSDEIFTRCIVCGKEMPVDNAMMKSIVDEGGAFAETSFSCLLHIVPDKR